MHHKHASSLFKNPRLSEVIDMKNQSLKHRKVEPTQPHESDRRCRRLVTKDIHR